MAAASAAVERHARLIDNDSCLVMQVTATQRAILYGCSCTGFERKVTKECTPSTAGTASHGSWNNAPNSWMVYVWQWGRGGRGRPSATVGVPDTYTLYCCLAPSGCALVTRSRLLDLRTEIEPARH